MPRSIQPALRGTNIVRFSRAWHDPEWDRFLAECPAGHHQQTSLWGELKGCHGWQPVRVVVNRGPQILGGVQILKKRFGPLGWMGYVNYGPVLAPGQPELSDLLLQELDHVAAEEGLTYLVVMPPYEAHSFAGVLRRLGFRPKPNHMPPVGELKATLILDLSEDLEILQSRMRASTRRHLRRAAREGVLTMREGTEADVETFRKLMWALCERRGVTPSPPQKEFFAHLWRIFRPSGFVRLFIAERDGQAVTAAIVFPFGDTVRFWKVGWAGDHAKCFPNEFLYWEAIRWSKRHGYRYFDFVQIDTHLALALQQGAPVDWSTVSGRSWFKIGFGGNPVVLPETFYRFYRPALHLLARAGGSQVIESAKIGRLASRLWSGLEL